MTALHLTFWKVQLYKHFQRFYPEWIRGIENRDVRCKGLYYYKHRPLIAEKDFYQTLQGSSIDQALESALQILTCDLPEPVYPELLRVLDDLKINELTDDAILNICDLIRNDLGEVTPDQVTPDLVKQYLTLQPLCHGAV